MRNRLNLLRTSQDRVNHDTDDLQSEGRPDSTESGRVITPRSRSDERPESASSKDSQDMAMVMDIGDLPKQVGFCLK